MQLLSSLYLQVKAGLSALSGYPVLYWVFALLLAAASLHLQLRKGRPRLKVTSGSVVGPDPRVEFFIKVVNVGENAVTVSDVGVEFFGTANRGAVLNPILADGGTWPRRLEPRTAVTAYFRYPVGENGRIPKAVYARTECGVYVTSRGKTLQAFSKKLRSQQLLT